MKIIIAVIICVVIYCIQDALYKRKWDSGLDVSLGFDEECVSSGGTGHITEIVANDKWLPLTAFHLKFSTDRSFRFDDDDNSAVTDSYHRHDGFSILSHQKITRKLEFTAEKRGYYKIAGANIIAMDLFMTHNYAKAIENNSYIYVLPARRYIKDIDIMCRQMLGEMTSKEGLVSDPYTFRGIREYRTGDSMRSINWKTSAKTGELAVNIYDRAAEYKVCILLNLDTHTMIRQESIQEYSIELAGSIASFFITKKIPTSLISNGEDIVTGKYGHVGYGATAGHMLSIDKYLARLLKKKENGSFKDCVDEALRYGDSGVSYVVVSSYCKPDILAMMDHLSHTGAGLYMIVPNFTDAVVSDDRPYIHRLEVAYDEVRA